MRIKSIKTRLLLSILPVVILSMGILTYSSTVNSKQVIDKQTEEQMNEIINNRVQEIKGELNKIETIAQTISYTVAATYKTTELKQYEELLGHTIFSNANIMGSGIWFEPYQYDTAMKYVGPYIYKDGDTVKVSDEYGKESYNYFARDWYEIAKTSDGSPVFTEPYFDEVMSAIMTTCSVPLQDEAGNFMGAITVDVELTSLQNIIDSIRVGETGHAFLINKQGKFLSHEDSNMVLKDSILESDNAELVDLGNTLLTNQNGKTTYLEDGQTYQVYYGTLEGLDWTVGIEISNQELFAPTVNLTKYMIIITLITIVIIFAVVPLQVLRLSSIIRMVKEFALKLSRGDFSIPALPVKTKDELGQMSQSLNVMYADNKDVIQKMKEHSTVISSASVDLNQSSSELLRQFQTITEAMQRVNSDMMTSSAATEEVNASIEEMHSSISLLTAETDKNAALAKEILTRAETIEKNSMRSQEQTQKLTVSLKESLQKSMENVQVVNSISDFANIIAGIAEQINLLSLNASIEAARAGEHGRGFAVVAGEIGKLAGSTQEAVNHIKDTIGKIQGAMVDITENSQSMLHFVTRKVTADYSSFVETGKQYEKDALAIDNFSNMILEMSQGILQIMDQVTLAVQNIAEISQDTAENGRMVTKSTEDVTGVVNQVSVLSESQEAVALELGEIVAKFHF